MGSGGIAPPFLTSSLDGERPASRPCRFTPGETAPGNHYRGGLLGLIASLDVMEKRKRTANLQIVGLSRRTRIPKSK
jgi:hypothetical protein